jgi:hypothetical protein
MIANAATLPSYRKVFPEEDLLVLLNIISTLGSLGIIFFGDKLRYDSRSSRASFSYFDWP